MDFSVLTDRPGAMARYQGYVGTDNYRSARASTRGALRGLASMSSPPG